MSKTVMSPSLQCVYILLFLGGGRHVFLFMLTIIFSFCTGGFVERFLVVWEVVFYER